MMSDFFSNKRYKCLKDLKVGVVRGGLSAERPISLRSGRAVSKSLKRIGFKVLTLDTADKENFLRKAKQADILFIALHGEGGEDGSLQEFLEQKKIIFTGSSSAACKKSFDKFITKKYFKKFGISTPESILLDKKDWKEKAEKFPTPYFAKPLDGGSSQGVFLVEDFSSSAEKIERSILKYGKILIEKRIFGRELTCGVLSDKKLPPIEVKPKRDFYDYKAKYTKGMTEYICPAKISKSVSLKIQNLALKSHKKLGLSGFSRVDIMLDKKNQPFALEINSIPGLTELSLLPKAARSIGISFDELCLEVLLAAWKKAKK